MYCICWRSLKFGRGLKRRPWDSNSLHKLVVDNSRLVPYTPQSVAASLAAVKRAEHAALNQSQNSLEHAQKIPNPHRFRESQPACMSAHAHTKDHRSNQTDPQRG